MLIQELISKKRNKIDLSNAEIKFFVEGLTQNSISDAQIASFAMAVCCNGMSVDERIWLTMSMKNSGDTLKWKLPGPVIDKHSTGGVGDTVSLVLAPALAACGAYVPMISGRSLGHTGGTLDKLDAIPGYNSEPNQNTIEHVVEKIGCAIIGQTNSIAPADKRFYAIRDVTSTIDSVDLITASILSKKLAAGLDSLILDVKCGSGAFMASKEDAFTLASSMVSVANGVGCQTAALITDMNQPLALSVGNSLEITAVLDLFLGKNNNLRLKELTCILGGYLLAISKLAADHQDGIGKIARVLEDGRAAERFSQMVSYLGGPNDLIDRPHKYLSSAPMIVDVLSLRSGHVHAINVKEIGLLLTKLGGGRENKEDIIDYSVGVDQLLTLGSRVQKGDVMCRIHCRTVDDAQNARDVLLNAYDITEENYFNKNELVYSVVN